MSPSSSRRLHCQKAVLEAIGNGIGHSRDLPDHLALSVAEVEDALHALNRAGFIRFIPVSCGLDHPGTWAVTA